MIEYFKIPPDEAAHYALVLCMAPGVSKRRGTQKSRTEGGGALCLAKPMELAMGNGFDYSLTNAQMGPETGDPTKFKDFEDVYRAFVEQLKFATALHFRNRDVCRRAEIGYCESPFLASMDDICVEEGLGAFKNTQYANTWSDPVSMPDAINSLAAIKKLIFEDKKYSMEDMVKALRANWEGYDEMRRDALNAPKWGNDDPYVDEIGQRIYNLMADLYQDQTQYSGMHPVPVPQTVSLYAARAPRVGALPYGRKHGEVLCDGGSSPYVGTDKKGSVSWVACNMSEMRLNERAYGACLELSTATWGRGSSRFPR